jgi:hypothetical protein
MGTAVAERSSWGRAMAERMRAAGQMLIGDPIM